MGTPRAGPGFMVSARQHLHDHGRCWREAQLDHYGAFGGERSWGGGSDPGVLRWDSQLRERFEGSDGRMGCHVGSVERKSAPDMAGLSKREYIYIYI